VPADGFERVHLKAGETKTVELYPAMDDLSQVREAQTTCFLHGAPKLHDHYGLSIFCMDKC
jgi:hypothetical protein